MENINKIWEYIGKGLVGVALVGGGGYWLLSGHEETTPSTPLDIDTQPASVGRIRPSTYTRTDNPTETRSFEQYGDRDCGDFSSQQEAQEFFEEEGGPATDYHNLDRDGDGVVCESL